MLEGTLCMLIKETDSEILLGRLKETKLAGKKGEYNFPGGKKKPDETLQECASRELYEETGGGILVPPVHMQMVAELTFVWPETLKKNNCLISVYKATRWTGEIKESNEMIPEWFPMSLIPYAQMYPADEKWVPHVLNGRQIKGRFEYDERKKLISHAIDYV